LKKSLFILFAFYSQLLIAQIDDFNNQKVIKDIGYYESGEIEYKSKTIRKGIDKSTGRIYGKQIIKLKEYYKNGQLELKEKKVIPRIVVEEHLGDDRYILLQKKDFRKYKMWDKDGKKIEKGKYTKRGKKRVVKYNFQGFKKVIITHDNELNSDNYIKKRPIYK